MGVMTPMEMLAEWERATAGETPTQPELLSYETRVLRAALLREEFREAMAEIGRGRDLQALAKELADLVYVCFGTAVLAGIDLDRVLAEVHRSNMSKVGPDGRIEKRADGKVLKGPNYAPPNLSWIPAGEA